MMNQQYINFDPPPAHHNAPETSRQAAESMTPHASRLAMKVLEYIKGRGKVSCAGIEIGLGMSHQTASARIWELRRAGLVRDSGERTFTPSGRRAVMWELREVTGNRGERPPSEERSASDAIG